MTYLTDTFGPLGPLYAIGALGALLIVAALAMFMLRKPDPMDRLNANTVAKETKKDEPTQRLRMESKNNQLDKFAAFLEPQDQQQFSAIRLKLIQASYLSPKAVQTFHFAQFALGIGFLILGVTYALLSPSEEKDAQFYLLSILGPGGAGYYLPTYWVERRRQARQDEIADGFPDALDLMLVCVEAGQSLDQSILRVSKEIHLAFPALAEEFGTVANEMKAGKDRVNVLRDFGERAGKGDISAFVTVLIQSASFGTSISDALRVYSLEMRDKRVMRAEEKANVLPTKLTLGTMMFTLPPLMIILIGPSIFDIYLTIGGGGVGP